MLTFYGYDKCSTCRKAKKWLEDRGHELKVIDITEHPPAQKLFNDVLKAGDYDLKQLFNRSGQLYRELNLKTELPDMTRGDAVGLLSQNGRLCKRPIVTDGKTHTIGFNEQTFKDVWG